MKLTSKTNALICELEAIETEAHKTLLISRGEDLRKNLLELYRLTSNQRSHELIVQIMAEGGYPWFENLASGAEKAINVSLKRATEVLDSNSNVELPLSDDDFMELLPANGYFH